MGGKFLVEHFLVFLAGCCYVTSEKSTGYDLFNQLLKYLNVDNNRFECEIDIEKDLGTPSPLFIRPGTSEFFHPIDRSGILTMETSQQMELFCTNGFSHPLGIEKNLVSVSCAYEKKFRVNGRLYNLKDFTCHKNPFHSVRRTSRCFNNASLVDIGFEVEGRFLNVFSVCHDPSSERTHYSKYKLTPAGVAAQRGFKRPKFWQGDFFPGKDVNNLYTRSRQRETIAEILDSEENANNLVDEKGDVFLSRGHLAARGDFIYANEQRSTFYFINVAPQWQSFNGLNWQAIEDGSRRLAANRNITLEVYTGTYGVIKLYDSEGVAREIFLDHDNKKVPVPKIFYKILLDKSQSAGVVLIGVNNPHVSMEEINRDYILCNDVSQKIKYIKWRLNDIRRGFVYACEVDDFLENVPHLKISNLKSLLI